MEKVKKGTIQIRVCTSGFAHQSQPDEWKPLTLIQPGSLDGWSSRDLGRYLRAVLKQAKDEQ